MAEKKGKDADVITEEDFNKFKEMTKTIVNLFHDKDFSTFEAFLVLEGVKQNIHTDLIYRTVQEVSKQPNIDLFYEGRVNGPYQ